jgi:hypothetical protein
MYNPNATGAIKEVGLMQLRREYLEDPDSYYNPRKNLKEGIKRLAKLKRLKDKLGENWWCAWNLGPTGALRLESKGELSSFHYCKNVKNKYIKLTQYKQNRFTDLKLKENYVSL